MKNEHVLPRIYVADNSLPDICRRKKSKTGHGPTKLSDKQVLEARALFEFAGWSMKNVAKRYNLSRIYSYQLLVSYAVRSSLIPKPEHVPRSERKS